MRAGASLSMWHRPAAIGASGILKTRTSKDLVDLDDKDLSSIDEIKSALALRRSQAGAKFQSRFLTRGGRKIVVNLWRRSGTMRVFYEVAPGIVGSLAMSGSHLDRPPGLVERASTVFRLFADPQ